MLNAIFFCGINWDAVTTQHKLFNLNSAFKSSLPLYCLGETAE